MKSAELLRSSSFRLSFIYMVLFASSVLILLGFIYWSTVSYMADQTDATIEAEITGLAEQYREGGLNDLVSTIKQRIARDPDSSSVYLFASPTYQALAGNITTWPETEPDEDGWLNFELKDVRADGDLFQARARPFVLQGGLHLLVGRDIRELRATQKLIINALAWGMALTLLLSLLGGIVMSRSMLKRIDNINQASREIMAGDMQRRISTDHSGDEFDQLANNLNDMLDQIETLMSGIRQVTDNIAHDLRTPLTRLRTRLEQLQAEPRDDTTQRSLIEQSISEADQLLSTFSALLRIARIEAGGLKENFTAVDLAELLSDAVDLYSAVAEERQVYIDSRIETSALVPGDRDLLFQAVINLIDNAIKYSPAGEDIKVSLYDGNSGPVISISDKGPGIPAEERENVLQRFYRMDDSRSLPGSGLGLSLVSAVATMHNIAFSLMDNHPGLLAELRFNK
jgi:signal transduction histidine kinase